MNVHQLILSLTQPRLYRYFQSFKKSQWLSREDLLELQTKRTFETIEYAYEHVPFYREYFDKAGVNPESFRELHDICKFPPVSKLELKNAMREKKIPEFPGKVSWEQTTGSSGVPFSFPIDIQAKDERMACMFRSIEWYGHVLGVKNARFWRTKKKSLSGRLKENIFGRRLDLSIFDIDDAASGTLSEDKIEEYIRQINSYRPKVIDGYVSTFVLISKYILEHKKSLYSPQSIVTGAEYLSDEARELISQAFDCPVFNRYGGTEIGLMAHEDEFHEMLVMDDKILLEICDKDGNPLPPGELGEIVITDFSNRALPFIRYRVGDMGILYDENYRSQSGRHFHVLKSVEGRVNDLMPLRDGSVIVAHLWYKLFREFQNIDNFQVIQHDFDLFEINLVLHDSNGDLSELKEQVNTLIHNATIHWIIVPKIIPGKGGKLRQTISHVKFGPNEMLDEKLDGDIKLVDVTLLLPHEEVDYEYVTSLADKIAKDGYMIKPIVIDAKSSLIIDGHHRYHVAQKLKLQKIPALLVDYFSEEIMLTSENPEAQTKNMVLAQAQSQKKFPYKTTKHVYGKHALPIVQCVVDANVPIDKLKS